MRSLHAWRAKSPAKKASGGITLGGDDFARATATAGGGRFVHRVIDIDGHHRTVARKGWRQYRNVQGGGRGIIFGGVAAIAIGKAVAITGPVFPRPVVTRTIITVAVISGSIFAGPVFAGPVVPGVRTGVALRTGLLLARGLTTVIIFAFFTSVATV